MPCGVHRPIGRSLIGRILTLWHVEVHASRIRCLTGTRKNTFAIAVSQSPKRYPDIKGYKNNTYDNPVAQPSG